MIVPSEFKPAWWLGNSHVQTIFPSLVRQIQAPIDRTEDFELPDGDFLHLAWAINGLAPEAPLVILLHGLCGDVRSVYVAGLLSACNRMGWRGVLMHFRGAGPKPNRLPRAYHSGETGDLDYFLQYLTNSEPHTKKAVVGVSLGGNVLLKWLGEAKNRSPIDAAVGVSVPFQLNMVADRVNQGFSRVYQKLLLNQLQQVFLAKSKQHHHIFPIPLDKIQAQCCFWTFDEYITAPLYGYPNVHAYYREASSRQYLTHIKTPTLLIHALDDPFMTPEILPEENELSSTTTLEVSEKGGHVGFVGGAIPGKPLYWLEERIPRFLKSIFEP